MSENFEITDVGEQTLMRGVAPISLGTKLTDPNAVQKSCDIGLFDEVGLAQIDLLDLINEMETDP